VLIFYLSKITGLSGGVSPSVIWWPTLSGDHTQRRAAPEGDFVKAPRIYVGAFDVLLAILMLCHAKTGRLQILIAMLCMGNWVFWSLSA